MEHTQENFPTKQDIMPFSMFIRTNMAGLHPVYFAAVMATGIISINFHLLHFTQASRFLFALNVLIYIVMCLLFLGRITFFTSEFISDCSDHQRAPGFFTIIAAHCILGTQFFLIGQSSIIAKIFFGIAVSLWLVAIYSIFLFLIVKKEKPTFVEGINGGWLVSIVATQAIPVLGCIFLNPSENNETILFILTSFWLFGGMLYIWIISIIFYRYMFFKFDPNDLMPPYWINMGAMAISSLAGSLILIKSSGSQLLMPIIPFIKGMTLMYWATATWWIPMLLLLNIWRHYMRGVKITYSPLYWGLVFPLGMYSACTMRLTQVLDVPSGLIGIAKLFATIGISAWALTFSGMLSRIFHAISLAFYSENFKKMEHLRSLQMNDTKTDKIKFGQSLVGAGIGTIVIGIILYCLNGFMIGVHHDISEFFMRNNTYVFYISMLAITAGTVVWTVGLMMYLNGVMEKYRND